MKKIDIFTEGMKTNKVEYDVYCKLSGANLEKLNLSVCENSKVTLSVPIVISENIDKLNSSSGYYNDICYTATSDSGTDISLADRKIEFVEGNKTVCQEDCEFSYYDEINQKANCSCKVKESSSSFENMNFDKNKLYENFINIKNIINIKIMRCYNVLFSIKGIKNNLAFFIIIPIIIFHLINIIIFYYNQKQTIKKKIKEIIFGINNWELVKEEEKEKVKSKNKEKKDKKKKEKEMKKKKERKKKLNKKENNFSQNDINQNLILMNIPNHPIKKRKIIKLNGDNHFGNINLINNRNNKNAYKQKGKILCSTTTENILDNQRVIKKIKKIMDYNDEEINNLPYIKALQIDHRTFCQYYISLLKTKHILIFTFYTSNDYNSRIIKIDLFFISFTLSYAVNALFFNDETVHKIYEDKGLFDIIDQLPQIIFSFLISNAIDIFLKLLALSEDDILELKKDKNKIDLNKRASKLYNKLGIKFIMHFIISNI